MSTWMRVLAGALLIAHGLVHLLYVADDVSEFSLDASWLVPESARHSIGVTAMWASVVAFGLLGLAVWGVPGLTDAWPAVAIVASVISLALMIAFWNPSLVFGILIDVAVISVAVARPDWI